MTAPVTKTIDGLSVTCSPLEPADAYDLLFEIQGAIAAGASSFKDAIRKLGVPFIIRLLATTVFVAPDGTKHVVRDRGTFNLAFSAHAKSVMSVVELALEVTFGGFFDDAPPTTGGDTAPPAA